MYDMHYMFSRNCKLHFRHSSHNSNQNKNNNSSSRRTHTMAN